MCKLQKIFGYIRLAGFVLISVFGALPHRADAGKVKQAVMELDLKNPGQTVSAVSFYIDASKLTKTQQDGIDVSSPAGQRNLFPAGSVTFDKRIANIGSTSVEYLQITLTPIKAWQQNQNIQFIVTVPGVDGVSIFDTATTVDGTVYGGPPQWFNNGTPPKPITPGPKLPGFMAKPKDTDYTVFNDTADPFGIDNLQFLPNITMSQFDALNLDSVLGETPTMALDLTAAQSSADFPDLPDPDPGNLFIAEGQLLNLSDSPIGAFAEGVQVVPEPSSLILWCSALTALLLIVGHGSIRRVMLSARRLGAIVAAPSAIPHIELLRIRTRVPVADPAMVTPTLAAALCMERAL